MEQDYKCIEWETGVFIRVVYTDGSERDVPSVPLAQGTSEGSCDGSMVFTGRCTIELSSGARGTFHFAKSPSLHHTLALR